MDNGNDTSFQYKDNRHDRRIENLLYQIQFQNLKNHQGTFLKDVQYQLWSSIRHMVSMTIWWKLLLKFEQ